MFCRALVCSTSVTWLAKSSTNKLQHCVERSLAGIRKCGKNTSAALHKSSSLEYASTWCHWSWLWINSFAAVILHHIIWISVYWLVQFWRRRQQQQFHICKLYLGMSVVVNCNWYCTLMDFFMYHASVHQAAKLVAALLRVARVTAGLAESNGSLPLGLWLTSSAGWLPRTGISSEPYARQLSMGYFYICLVFWVYSRTEKILYSVVKMLASFCVILLRLLL